QSGVGRETHKMALDAYQQTKNLLVSYGTAPLGLPRDAFMTRIESVIEEATNRLVAAGQAEQAQLFGRVPAPVKA
ncbi:MAG: hypothetical protein E7B62_17030, partial [Bradyrhizobium sp.]|nr:hypothetical protein [Bradyrhizobium sp.]